MVDSIPISGYAPVGSSITLDSAYKFVAVFDYTSDMTTIRITVTVNHEVTNDGVGYYEVDFGGFSKSCKAVFRNGYSTLLARLFFDISNSSLLKAHAPRFALCSPDGSLNGLHKFARVITTLLADAHEALNGHYMKHVRIRVFCWDEKISADLLVDEILNQRLNVSIHNKNML
jgi:hypothetical protein